MQSVRVIIIELETGDTYLLSLADMAIAMSDQFLGESYTSPTHLLKEWAEFEDHLWLDFSFMEFNRNVLSRLVPLESNTSWHLGIPDIALFRTARYELLTLDSRWLNGGSVPVNFAGRPLERFIAPVFSSANALEMEELSYTPSRSIGMIYHPQMAIPYVIEPITAQTAEYCILLYNMLLEAIDPTR